MTSGLTFRSNNKISEIGYYETRHKTTYYRAEKQSVYSRTNHATTVRDFLRFTPVI